MIPKEWEFKDKKFELNEIVRWDGIGCSGMLRGKSQNVTIIDIVERYMDGIVYEVKSDTGDWFTSADHLYKILSIFESNNSNRDKILELEEIIKNKDKVIRQLAINADAYAELIRDHFNRYAKFFGITQNMQEIKKIWSDDFQTRILERISAAELEVKNKTNKTNKINKPN